MLLQNIHKNSKQTLNFILWNVKLNVVSPTLRPTVGRNGKICLKVGNVYRQDTKIGSGIIMCITTSILNWTFFKSLDTQGYSVWVGEIFCVYQ